MLNCKKNNPCGTLSHGLLFRGGLLDCEPDGFVAGFGLDDFLFEFVEPLAGFEDLSYELVAAYGNYFTACFLLFWI